MSATPPERLNAALEGRYRIDRQIGEGGMATVYLADDLKHERKVALKLLKPELAAVVGAERFLAEIKTTANLQHPHILPLYDSGQADSFLFYVMPYVEGETLRDRLDRQHQLPVDEAVRIARNVAEGLDYAHRQGVIHRDIKPANILMQDGKPVISDFGIALAVGAAGGGRLTETGLSMGTPHYMSPEQATGDMHVGPETDIYALGCVLYEMLVGEPPHTGSTPQAVLGKIITEPPPRASKQRKAVPTNVEAAIAKSLEKVPADRFPGSRDFATALMDPTFSHGDVHDAQGPRSGAVLAASALAGAAVVILVGLSTDMFGPAPLVRFGAVTKVTFEDGLELAPALSPDGRDLAYVATTAARRPTVATQRRLGPDERSARIMVRPVDGGRPVAVTDESFGEEDYPAWSPDGAFLSLHAAGGVYRVPARGGVPRAVVPAGDDTIAQAATWSPGGGEVAYVLDTGGTRRILVRDEDGREREVTQAVEPHSLRWSPDGRWIAYVEGNRDGLRLGDAFGNKAPSAVMVVSADGGSPVAVTARDFSNASPAWLPDGRLLFISSRGGARDIYLTQLRTDGSPEGPPTRVTAGLEPYNMSLSADARRLAYSKVRRRQNIYAMSIPSTPASAYGANAVTTGSQVVEGIAVSPDGAWIAFDSDKSGNQDVYRRRLGGGETLQLTATPTDEFVRSWSPDGTWIYGHGFREEQRDIFRVDFDGLSLEHLAPDSAQDRYPDIAPDGRRILFDAGQRPDQWLRVIELNSAGSWQRTESFPERMGRRARWSPDGSMIAFVDPDGARAVVVIPAAGGAPILSVSPAEDDLGSFYDTVEWYAEGQRLLALKRHADSTSGLYDVPLEGGVPRELIRFDDPARQPRPEMAVHDGVVYFTLGEFESDVWVMDLEWR
jgi:serine/threonine-protein kinase